MLELINVSYQPATNSQLILNKVSIKIGESNLIMISGKSGSGKTTLLETIGGLIKPNKGKIFWGNDKISERKRRWLCGIVFQFPERYFLGNTIANELQIGQERINFSKREKLLEKVGLNGVDISKRPETLSGGQQRRLAIAIQLIRNPPILLLDEPTSGLDWSIKSEIIKLLNIIKKEQTIVLVTHEPSLFENFADAKYSLEEGILNKI
tara:strand:+ start:5298 stop:5924 length:627 start_codon:yes stop_codon:yes gene_type:complete